MSVFPKSAGYPNFSSDATNKYTPQIFSKLLIKRFYPNTFLTQISNTQYEGEIKNYGDTIFMRTRPTIDIFDYSKGMTLPVQSPESAAISMQIDQGKGFSLALDKIDEVQNDIDLMKLWADDSAEQLKIEIETNVLDYSYPLVSAYNSGLTAGKISGNLDLGVAGTPQYVSSNGLSAKTGADAANAEPILNILLKAGQSLDEQNIPQDGRFFIMPAWAVTALKASELRQAYLTGDNKSPLRNGDIGMIDRFKVYQSNLVPTDGSGGFYCMFGHSLGLTFATQITESRVIENPHSFGKLYQGLQVFGRKVTNPEALGVALIKPGSSL